jgi:hypothetical protein
VVRAVSAKYLAATGEEVTMQDVTSGMERTVQALQHLWNEYFYVGDDMTLYAREVEALFEQIESGLLGALVLFEIDRLGFMNNYRRQPLPFLVVSPQARGTRLLVERPASDGNRYWDAFDGDIAPGDAVLHFIGWFDWDRFTRRTFEYYRVHVAEFALRPEFVGREALIERSEAAVMFDPKK